jgi:hypothetical protein
LEVWRPQELLLGVRSGLLDQVRLCEQPLDETLHELPVCDAVNDSAPFNCPSPTSEMSTGIALSCLAPTSTTSEIHVGRPSRLGDDLLQQAQEDREHLHAGVAVVDDPGHEVIKTYVGGDVLAEQVERLERDLVLVLDRSRVAAQEVVLRRADRRRQRVVAPRGLPSAPLRPNSSSVLFFGVAVKAN